MKKWAKASLIIAPLVMGTSVYALADERSSAQATVQIQEVQPADSVSAVDSSQQETLNIQNPFIVNKEQILRDIAALQSPAAPGDAGTLSIEQIRKLHINAKTDRGELNLEYSVEGNGTPRLNGHVGDLNIHLSGHQAKTALNNLMTRWELLDVLQKVLADPNVQLNGKILMVLKDFEIETVDGKKIKLDEEKLKANAEEAKKQVPSVQQTLQPLPHKIIQPAAGPDDNGHYDDHDKDHQTKEKHQDKGKHKGNDKKEKGDD